VRVAVVNATPVVRREVVEVSVPYPEGVWDHTPATVLWRPVGGPLASARGRGTEAVDRDGSAPRAAPVDASVPVAARVAMRWPDGSPALLRVAAPCALDAAAVSWFEVVPAPPGATAVPAVGDHWDPLPAFESVLQDPWGRLWRGTLEPDPSAGADGVLWELGDRRAVRLRGLHRRGEEAFLGLGGYLVTTRGSRFAELTLLLDNGPRAALPPGAQDRLGPVRFRSWELISTGPEVRFRPRFAAENHLQPPLPRPEGGFQQILLAPADDLYLGDGTAKAFRFDLFDAEGATDEDKVQAMWRGAWPLRPLPELGAVRHSGAFGAHGGPAPRLVEGSDLTSDQLAAWRRSGRFGPFGGFGDREDAAAQGTARNGASVLHNVVRWTNPELLEPAEGMLLQHTLRPDPGRNPVQPDDMAAFREGLGVHARRAPHGFVALDYEHFSVGLLFDWYWLTADPLALRELARMGRGLRSLVAGVPFATCRGEGWCLQSAALIARATGDEALARDLVDRFFDDVWPGAADPESGMVLPQPAHEMAFSGAERFDAPWQMAALLHGFHAMLRAPGLGEQRRERLRAAAGKVALVMGGPGWVDGVGPKYLVSERGADRYTLEAGDDPLTGTAWMQVGGFVLGAEMTTDEQLKELMGRRMRSIVEPAVAGMEPATLARIGAHPWFQLALDRGWVAR